MTRWVLFLVLAHFCCSCGGRSQNGSDATATRIVALKQERVFVDKVMIAEMVGVHFGASLEYLQRNSEAFAVIDSKSEIDKFFGELDARFSEDVGSVKTAGGTYHVIFLDRHGHELAGVAIERLAHSDDAIIKTRSSVFRLAKIESFLSEIGFKGHENQ